MKGTAKKCLLFTVAIFIALAMALTFAVNTSAGQSHNITITLENEAGNPIAYEWVEIYRIGDKYDPKPEWENDGSTNFTGEITFHDVPTDNYRYRVPLLEGMPNRGNYAVASGFMTVVSDVSETVTLKKGPSAIFNVKDEDNVPIENIGVFLQNQTDYDDNDYLHYDHRYTDSEGTGHFEHVLPDNYQYVIASGAIEENYVTQYGQIEIAGENFEENFTLENAPYTITFNVKDENNDPVENAEVYVERENNGDYIPYSRKKTDENGILKFSVPSDNYRYEVLKDNYSEEGYIEVTESDVTRNITLKESPDYQSPYIKLNVQDLASGENIGNATVNVWRLENMETDPPDFVFIEEKETGADGIVVFENLSIDNYLYNVGKDNYADNAGFVPDFLFDNFGNEVTRLVTLSDADYGVTFDVVDENENSVENALVALEDNDTGRPIAVKETDENGEAMFGVVADNYDYGVIKEGYQQVGGKIEADGYKTENVTLVKIGDYESPFVSLDVVKVDGILIENAIAELWHLEGQYEPPVFVEEMETDKGGRVVFENLVGGELCLQCR